MAGFTFADFLVFADTGDINEDTYVTIAKGVISYINKQYGIYPEVASITEKYFYTTSQVIADIPIFPIRSVYRVTYDDTIIDSDTYSYYGEDIAFDTAPVSADPRKPIYLGLDVGFEDGAVPDDLVLAVYRHILATYFAIDKHTDNIEKSINATGNTTVYKHDVVPVSSRFIYEFYAGHTLIKN